MYEWDIAITSIFDYSLLLLPIVTFVEGIVSRGGSLQNSALRLFVIAMCSLVCVAVSVFFSFFSWESMSRLRSMVGDIDILTMTAIELEIMMYFAGEAALQLIVVGVFLWILMDTLPQVASSGDLELLVPRELEPSPENPPTALA